MLLGVLFRDSLRSSAMYKNRDGPQSTNLPVLIYMLLHAVPLELSAELFGT